MNDYLNAYIEAKKERDEARQAYKTLIYTSTNASMCEDLMKERDEARKECDSRRKSNEILINANRELMKQRDEADLTADFWEAKFDDAQANLAKAYAELSNRTLDSLDSDDAIGSEPLLVVFTFGGLD